MLKEDLKLKRYMIHCQNIDVRVTEWGDRDKPVIFCLHGLGSTALSFIEVADKLKDDYFLLAIDAPGHGMSQSFQDDHTYDFPQFCEWLNELLDMLNVNRFYFLSHSWGSFIHLYYLIEYGTRVDGSILIDGGYQSKRLRRDSPESEAAFYEKDFEEYCESWNEFETIAVYDGISRRSSLLDLAAQDLALHKDNRYYWHARRRTGAAIIKSMYRDEILEFLPRVQTNLITLLRATLPAEDEPFKVDASNQLATLTGALIKAVPSTSHMLHWDNPDRVVQEVQENWITSVSL